ncbi:hypothetical protein TrLO_g2305 [Triparma laevis f. longispina]|uniref:Uncharacterized protein n=1 Tax=Triparma laevis f. longispina TaxID=1714387 RepID=A0A9W7CK68_9STRA|nr:hypothetical protein TrLO_g2305 [Triparma laevis f. longispina]
MPPPPRPHTHRSKGLHSFYGTSKNHAKSWDNVYVQNSLPGRRFGHQMPSRRPGFGSFRMNDPVFNEGIRNRERLYLDYLKTYAILSHKLSEGVTPSSNEIKEMNEKLIASGFKTTRSPLINKKKRKVNGIPVRYSKRLAGLNRKKT